MNPQFRQLPATSIGAAMMTPLAGSPPLSLLAAFDILSVVTVCLSWDTCFFSLVFLPALRNQQPTYSPSKFDDHFILPLNPFHQAGV